MKKTKKDKYVEFLLEASLFKQKLEHEMHTIWGVPYSQMRFYTNACTKMGRILERMHQGKIKDGKRGRK